MSIQEDKIPTIVWVDDSPGFAEDCAEFLQIRIKCEVKCFEDPQKAIEHIVSEKPDLVITDLSMPKISGGELITKIKEALGENSPKIIVFSGNVGLKMEGIPIVDKLSIIKLPEIIKEMLNTA